MFDYFIVRKKKKYKRNKATKYMMNINMWNEVTKYLKDYPARLAVAKLLIENGISVRNGKTYCGKIMISSRALSQAADVDQRTVNRTLRTIEERPQLMTFFQNIKPAGPSILEIAKFLGFGVVEITPTNAKKYGILAASSSLLASKKICIRQAIVDDPELTPEPKLTLIIEKKIPGEVVAQLLNLEGISRVTVY
jgi:hypothetical protein